VPRGGRGFRPGGARHGLPHRPRQLRQGERGDGAYFNEPYPARAAIGVASLPRGARSSGRDHVPGRARGLAPVAAAAAPPRRAWHPHRARERHGRDRAPREARHPPQARPRAAPAAALRGRDQAHALQGRRARRARPGRGRGRRVEGRVSAPPHAGGEAHRRRARAVGALPQLLSQPGEAVPGRQARAPLRRGAPGFFGDEMVHPKYRVVAKGAPLSNRSRPSIRHRGLSQASCAQIERRSTRSRSTTRSTRAPREARLRRFRESVLFLHRPPPDVDAASLDERTHPGVAAPQVRRAPRPAARHAHRLPRAAREDAPRCPARTRSPTRW
jgi:hypothetical protein